MLQFQISVTLLNPVRQDLITYLSEDLGLNIHNPNGSCTESESPNSSVMYNTMRKANVNDNYEEIDDVIIEDYLKDCETFPQEIFECEDECIDPVSEKPDVVEALPSTEIKDPVLTGKLQFLKNVKTNSESTAGATSSLDSLSWNDMVNKEIRLTSSTPQIKQSISSSQTDPSESFTESSYTDVVDFLGEDIQKIFMDIGNISRSSLTVFQGHMRGGDSEVFFFIILISFIWEGFYFWFLNLMSN